MNSGSISSLECIRGTGEAGREMGTVWMGACEGDIFCGRRKGFYMCWFVVC